MRIYIGIDPRQPVAYNVLQWSITRRASKPVSIIPLVLPTLPITRTGLTDFTYSRYLCPALSGYQGISLFMDADMLVLDDICKLQDFVSDDYAVSVYKSKQKFEWPSLMLFNNSKCKTLTTEYINNPETKPQSFEWADAIGELPVEWNYCVGYEKDDIDAKIVHYTAGIPDFAETRNCKYSGEWREEYQSMTSNCSWLELMGDSVHANLVLQEIQERKNTWQLRHTQNSKQQLETGQQEAI